MSDCVCGHSSVQHLSGFGQCLQCQCPGFSDRSRAPDATENATMTPSASTMCDASPTSPQKRTTPRATRERLPEERRSFTKVFRLQYTHKDGTDDVMHFYFQPGEYADGRLGECFIKADKVGSLASGLMDTIGVLISLLLQYGIPLEAITDKLRNTRFSPSGFTRDQQVPRCTSPMDLLAQYLSLKYIPKDPTDG